MTLLNFLDLFFYTFHIILILFNTFGWVFKKTRKANLICLLVTFLSWFGLGLIYGIGYCPLTDWHWEVKNKLGQGPLPANYIQHLFEKFLGLNFSNQTVEYLTFGVLFSSLILSIGLNFRDYKLNKI